MAVPEFDGFSLQDANYVTSELNYRSIPSRSLDVNKISRRPGVKLLAHDFAERVVSLRGYVIGSNATDLQSKVDDLHKNITRKDDGALSVQTGRSATATVRNVAIADPHYAQDFVPFEIEFLLADPFFYGAQQVVTTTVVSGTITHELTITISGSVFSEPYMKYSSPSGTGDTTTSGISVAYGPTGETVTWSGTGGNTTLSYADSVTFDYANQLILEGTNQVDVEGVFSRWEPQETNITVTFSGTAQGGELEFGYQPRYL